MTMPDDFEIALFSAGHSASAVKIYMARTGLSYVNALMGFQMVGFRTKGMFDRSWRNTAPVA
jgi:hypothetical protein